MYDGPQIADYHIVQLKDYLHSRINQHPTPTEDHIYLIQKPSPQRRAGKTIHLGQTNPRAVPDKRGDGVPRGYYGYPSKGGADTGQRVLIK